ncbi:MAG: sn-glycerol-1-phosphate dehydrogenase [Clostridia bacterium]|nr:sn-glycerol-1-phosphate dehydrogenase [Clostridia bacterium]
MSGIKKANEKVCRCGKKHDAVLPVVISGGGAINRLAETVLKVGAKKAFVLSDLNTYEVAGQKVCALLDGANIPYQNFVFASRNLKPDEKTDGSAVMDYKKDCEIIIGVGSGVINDTCKILAATAKLPYIIVATAPSMDGYASASSSMDVDGLKASLPTKCADFIIGDTDILKDAPARMLKAGLGDMLAKYVSIAEWRISHEITGEYYCEAIADEVRKALQKCVDNADGLLKREPAAVEAVFDGLVLCGAAMAKAGVSRPASGVEHYFSHIWDMRGLEFGTKTDLHGIQCAVGTLYAARLYEKVLKIRPDRQKALDHAKNFDYAKWSEELKTFLGKGATSMIALEKKEGKYDLKSHKQRLEIIIKKWDKILEIIKKEIPTEKRIAEILDSVGIEKGKEELGIEGSAQTTFKATKDIRDKYVLSRLVWDLGAESDILSDLR